MSSIIRRSGRVTAKLIVPLAVLSIAMAITAAMISARPPAESVRPVVIAPLVEVVTLEAAPVQIEVEAQGTVEPRTESELVTEVAGRIVWTSPELAAGGFFEEGDPLVRIDARDYTATLEGARAALARAESNRVLAKATLERHESMRQTGASSRARLDDAIHGAATAAAGLREAQVAVTRAELDLERTEIRAPFVGRVREKHVDVGQYAPRGVPVARVYSIEYAEVRLPITNADLAYLDLPLGFGIGLSPAAARPAPTTGAGAAGVAIGSLPTTGSGRLGVRISAEFAGRRQEWHGYIVRTEGALDPRTRMLNIVARVDDPYGRSAGADRSPLPIGLFVDAVIEGRIFDGAFELPRSALWRPNLVLVIDHEDRLRVRRVVVLRSDRTRTWISAGLESGERVVVTPLEVATEGMTVRAIDRVPREDDASAAQLDGSEGRSARISPGVDELRRPASMDAEGESGARRS